MPLLKDRDFLYREVTQKLPNGVMVIYGQSLSKEEEQEVEGVPSIKGVTRGEMGSSGWVIAPIDGGAASRVTYVALTDLKVHKFSAAQAAKLVACICMYVRATCAPLVIAMAGDIARCGDTCTEYHAIDGCNCECLSAA